MKIKGSNVVVSEASRGPGRFIAEDLAALLIPVPFYLAARVVPRARRRWRREEKAPIIGPWPVPTAPGF